MTSWCSVDVKAQLQVDKKLQRFIEFYTKCCFVIYLLSHKNLMGSMFSFTTEKVWKLFWRKVLAENFVRKFNAKRWEVGDWFQRLKSKSFVWKASLIRPPLPYLLFFFPSLPSTALFSSPLFSLPSSAIPFSALPTPRHPTSYLTQPRRPHFSLTLFLISRNLWTRKYRRYRNLCQHHSWAVRFECRVEQHFQGNSAKF